ncbi:hypothetical protein P4661_27330 [Priestia megaterium]|uniref:hypothetical protein n=1 Tax=Priestia megaterium TaxID=1404 RepID=UPI002E1F3016|nr:hypothetical protein [Priestia megaterium]
MATRIGGHLPDDYGLSLTVIVPTASETNPINTGDTLTLATTGSYHAAKAAAGAAVQLIAKHPVSDPYTPLGVHAFGFSRVSKVKFSGTAPTIGASVEADGEGGVRTAAAANGTYVLFVNAAGGFAEIAFP